MNLKYILLLLALFSIGQLVMSGEGKAKPPQVRSPKQDEIITVEYCDLVNNQVKYAGKLIRLKATFLAWLDGTSLYDTRCKHVSDLEPVLDCNDQEQCSAMREMLGKKIDYDGDVGRVDAVLVGKLLVPVNGPTDKARSKFMIKTIEQVTRIPRDVPWPGR